MKKSIRLLMILALLIATLLNLAACQQTPAKPAAPTYQVGAAAFPRVSPPLGVAARIIRAEQSLALSTFILRRWNAFLFSFYFL